MSAREKLLRVGLRWDAAVKRLDPEQGRVARRNARHAALRALREMRAALDAEFPVIRKTGKRHKPVSREKRAAKLRSRGWLPASKFGREQRGWYDRLPRRAVHGPTIRRARWFRVRWFPRWLLACKSMADVERAHRSLSTQRELDALALVTLAQPGVRDNSR